jgi:copper transport protein
VARLTKALRALTPVAAATAALLLSPAAAFAHAAFVGSTPEPGTRLATSPRQVVLDFTEPLNRRLSRATLLGAGGSRVPAQVRAASNRRLVLTPAKPLPTGAYGVEWHTVSTLDGHALEGSFSFGVRAAAPGGEHTVEQSPLARDGWARVLLRACFYAALLFFAGGLLTDVLLARRGPHAGWLAPATLPDLSPGDREVVAQTAWRRTRRAGWLAAGLGVAVALAEAADAGGALTADNVTAFLFSNAAGLARVGAVVAVAAAVLLAERHRGPAVVALVASLEGIAFSGHANSADPRWLALLTDLIHLTAAAVWVGGIAQIAATWLPRLRSLAADTRRALPRAVLARFGRVALPAFLVVALTGGVNALIQLGHVSALWEDGYGRVLAVKILLVALIAAASYAHALRLRPRLLAANPHPSAVRERRHWRLLGSEPVLAVGVLAVTGLLVAFPLPPSQLQVKEAQEPAAPPVPVVSATPAAAPRPAARELAVADHAGSVIVAAWLRTGARGLEGRLRLYGAQFSPVNAPVSVTGATSLRPCGPGCRSFTVPGRPDRLDVRVRQQGRSYAASLPAAWRQDGSARARRLIERTLRTMRRLQGVQIDETLSSGPSSFVATDYSLRAPNRFAYRLNNGARTIIIGRSQWTRSPGGPWLRSSYGGSGSPPFRTADYLGWWRGYTGNARLLDSRRGRAEVALLQSSGRRPVWLRLALATGSGRLLDLRMITEGHFMTQRYRAFDRRPEIEPPR